MKKIFTAALLAFALVFALRPLAQPQSPQETLTQYISDLQKKPDDNPLREKTIKFVQEMKPAPAIPEEARRYFIEGNALLKAAKEQKGYGLALDAYRQCLLAAPWWAEAYYNYSVALELANRFDEAVNILKLYIATNPGGEESRKAQDKIYEIGAKKKLAAQEREESSPKAIAAKKQNEFEQWFKRLDGARYQRPPKTGDCAGVVGVFLEIRGSTLAWGVIQRSNRCYPELPVGEFFALGSRYEIRGREVTARVPWGEGHYDATWIISEDKITESRRYSDGDVTDDIYRRVR